MPYKTPKLRRANYLANREKQLKQGKLWKKRNRSKARASYTRWAKKYPDKVKAKRKAYYEANKEAAKAYSMKYRAEHSVLVKKSLAEWKKKNPDKVSALLQKRRAAKTAAGGAYTYIQWVELCKRYHNKCLSCNKKKRLTPDHVIPISKGGTSNISNIQPLCGSCNSSKGTKIVDYRRETNNGRQRSRSCRNRH
jgi:5-methylcytosine-specific restriction endonuclease McrA